jgi:hypothetical protein
MANCTLRADSARTNPSLQSPNLRIAISAALKHYGIAPTRFGRLAANDPQLVFDITRREREPRPHMVARIRDFIASLDREARHG